MLKGFHDSHPAVCLYTTLHPLCITRTLWAWAEPTHTQGSQFVATITNFCWPWGKLFQATGDALLLTIKKQIAILWREPHGRERWAAFRIWGPSTCNHNKLDSANSHQLGKWASWALEDTVAPSDTLISTQCKSEPKSLLTWFLQHTHCCETIHLCCFEPCSMWGFVVQP